jgi:hypothetical protein
MIPGIVSFSAAIKVFLKNFLRRLIQSEVGFISKIKIQVFFDFTAM